MNNNMEGKLVDKLVGELAEHIKVFAVDRKLFSKVLGSADVSNSWRFSEQLADAQQLVEESDRDHYLSLRRILRNRKVGDEDCKPKFSDLIGDAFISRFGVYSSGMLTRKLATNQGIAGIMSMCEVSFSLLGKLQTYDYSKPETTTVATKPILVIPGVRDSTVITDWEDSMTTYEREGTSLFRPSRRISKAEYLAR
jgi:hypothetical protein